MSKIAHTWHSDKPTATGVYITRRNKSKYTTPRYWDGERWFEIAWRLSRGGTPFKWPKGSPHKFPRGMECYRDTLGLRRIHQGMEAIEWGVPHKVYEPNEVIKYLVLRGVLPKDWETRFQADMRDFDKQAKEQGTKGI